MENSKISEIVISAFISAITTILTLHLNRKKEIKAHIYNKREEVYLSVFESFEKLMDDKWKIFQGELNRLKENKAKIHLYAFNKVIENYDKLLDVLTGIADDFSTYSMNQSDYDLNINEKDEEAITNIIANHEDELGMKVTDLMYSLIRQMRKEMKI